MTKAEHISQVISTHLLELEAVKLQPDDPFTWASGIKSPIYCDNRILLSDVQARRYVHDAMADVVKVYFPNAEGIAGVATAGIPHSAVVADSLSLPMIYVRSKAKGHGRQNLIEGALKQGMSYVVIEDLISTGGSVLQAVEAIRNCGATVAGVIAIFTYGFQRAKHAFLEADCEWHTLSDFDSLAKQAMESNYISDSQLTEVLAWRNRTGKTS